MVKNKKMREVRSGLVQAWTWCAIKLAASGVTVGREYIFWNPIQSQNFEPNSTHRSFYLFQPNHRWHSAIKNCLIIGFRPLEQYLVTIVMLTGSDGQCDKWH